MDMDIFIHPEDWIKNIKKTSKFYHYHLLHILIVGSWFSDCSKSFMGGMLMLKAVLNGSFYEWNRNGKKY